MIFINRYRDEIIVSIFHEPEETHIMISGLFKEEDLNKYSNFRTTDGSYYIRVFANAHTIAIYDAMCTYLDSDGGYAGLTIDEYIKNLGL